MPSYKEQRYETLRKFYGDGWTNFLTELELKELGITKEYKQKITKKKRKNMILSTHFLLKDLTRSELASKLNIDNTPNKEQITNLRELAVNVLDPIAELVINNDSTDSLIINSGFRCLEINRKLNSKDTSQHVKGQAADIEPKKWKLSEFYRTIANSDIEFDQLIYEFDSWVHVSYAPGANRKQLVHIYNDEKTNKVSSYVIKNLDKYTRF